MPLRAVARIDLDAIAGNARTLVDGLAPNTALGAVVKADGYGHGAVPVARAARAGGAAWIFVATAREARELRAAGIEGPIVVMGALSSSELAEAVAASADVVAWRVGWVEALPAGVRVHVKLDTGMGRLGTRDSAEATAVAEAVAARADSELVGAMTHYATADSDPDFLGEQRALFRPWAEALKTRFGGLVRHAANSAATLRGPEDHFDLVRCGIALYGLDPFGADPAPHALRPAMELATYVAALKRVEPGQSAGYGRTWRATRPTWLATLPIGYGDGVRRGLSNRAVAVIGGHAYPLVGNVSMDNVTVDVGPEPDVDVGDEALLLGPGQPAERLAELLDTINYEITCGISARVPRVYSGRGSP